jgi:hypothetical protein
MREQKPFLIWSKEYVIGAVGLRDCDLGGYDKHEKPLEI